MSVEVGYRPDIREGPCTEMFCPRCSRLCWQRVQRFRPGEREWLARQGKLPSMQSVQVFCKNGCSEMYSNWSFKQIMDNDVPQRLRDKLLAEVRYVTTRRD